MHQFEIAQNILKEEAIIGHYKRIFTNEKYHFVIMYDYSSLERVRSTSLKVSLTQFLCEDGNEECLSVLQQTGKEKLAGSRYIDIACNQPVNNMILLIPQNQSFISHVRVCLHEEIDVENIVFYYEKKMHTGKLRDIQDVLQNPLMQGSSCIKSWSCSKGVIEIQFELLQFNPNTLNMIKSSDFSQYEPFTTDDMIENRSYLFQGCQDLDWQGIGTMSRPYQNRPKKYSLSKKTKNPCPLKQRGYQVNKRKSPRIEEWSLDSFGYEETCSQDSRLDAQGGPAGYKKIKTDKMKMNSKEAKSIDRYEFEKVVSEESNRKKVMSIQKQKKFSESFAGYNFRGDDPKKVEDKLDLMLKDVKSEFKPLIGLRNIGNTCYMNSVIECLIYHPKLCDNIIRNTPRQPGKLACALQTIFERILHGSQVPVAFLKNIKSAVGITNKNFRNHREKDALEFFKSLLEGLDNELTRIHTKPPYKQLRSRLSFGESLQNLSDEWFNYLRAREDSVIHDHFRGQFLTINKCKECKNSRFSFDAYWDFPLAFRKADIQSGEVAIEEMLWVATKQENVLETTFCADCKGETECTNQQRVWRLPETLVFYLKRFQLVEEQEEFAKVDVKVDFPVDFLDMSPFLHEESLARSQGTKYRLFGIVDHRGNLDGGHYIAECLHPLDNNWYLFNDSYVRRIGERKGKLVSDTSILLFYIKQPDTLL